MSHLVEQMAYAGETPWHGLGKQKSPKESVRAWMEDAGVAFKVYKDPLFRVINGEYVQTDQTALVRDTDNSILDYVPEDWEPNQNETFVQFYEDFIKAGQMEMHTMGSLDSGRMVWALAKMHNGFKLFGKDLVESYLLFSNPHKYGKSIDIRFTSVRVVCNNTLTLALGGKSDLIIKQTHRKEFDTKLVQTTIENALNLSGRFQKQAEFLSKKKFKKDQLEDYFAAVFPGATNRKKSDELSRPAMTALSYLDKQPGAEFGAGTWWQPFNATTFVIDHVLGNSQETRLQSAWYGQNRNRKLIALEKAIEFAGK